MVRADLKIALVGHQHVGKTTLVERFGKGFFGRNEDLRTLGTLYKNKILEVDGKTINIGIWDLGGEQKWEILLKECYKNVNAVIVCYDPSERESFRRAKYWLRELRHLPEKCKIYVCATKSDLLKLGTPTSPDLQIDENYAKLMKAKKFFLTSSKTGMNVVKLFEEVTRDYISTPEYVKNLEKLEQMEFEEPPYYSKSKAAHSHNSNCSCFSWFWIWLRRCIYK